MLIRTYLRFAVLLSLALVLTDPLKAQVEPSASGGPTADDDSIMMTPPPVSGVPYASTAGSEARSNYLNTGLTLTPAYIDNVLQNEIVLQNETAGPVGAFSGTIAPSVTFDRSSPRHMEQVTYSPIFSFYEPTSTLNSIDQSASVVAQFRLSPRAELSFRDSLLKTSNVFNESYPFSNPISGSAQTSTPVVIAPFAEQFMNSTTGDITYQFSANAMVGGGASYNTFNLPNQSQVHDFYNSNGLGGSAFYSRRVTRAQYFGLAYEYERVLTYPVNSTSEARTHSLLPFYTLYFSRTFSMSISAGIERISETASPSFQFNSWEPSINASVGWQGRSGSAAAGYLRGVTAGGGLLGAQSTNGVSGSGSWRLFRMWTGAASASYTVLGIVGQAVSPLVPVGHTVTTQVSLSHALSEHLTANFGYQYLSQSYGSIGVIAANPNSNREFVSVTYQLNRPLGR